MKTEADLRDAFRLLGRFCEQNRGRLGQIEGVMVSIMIDVMGWAIGDESLDRPKMIEGFLKDIVDADKKGKATLN